jgi:hypothetical protein
MRPYGLILLSKERIGIELVRVHRSILVVFHPLPRHWVMATNRYLREDVVGLNWDEDVVGWNLGYTTWS